MKIGNLKNFYSVDRVKGIQIRMRKPVLIRNESRTRVKLDVREHISGTRNLLVFPRNIENMPILLQLKGIAQIDHNLTKTPNGGTNG